MKKTNEIIKDLKEQGFDYQQIKDAMEDGEYLGETGIDQETAEDVHAEVSKLLSLRWIIRDKEAGNVIDEFVTLEDAEKELKEFENQDKEDGNYTPDFYEIVEKEI